MNIIKIRFNHNHNGSGLIWRVNINGVEKLAAEVQCMGTGFKTTMDDVDGEQKAHITIQTVNEPVWAGTVVFIN